MTTASAYTHCPNCLAEYRAGYTICTDCGSLLVPGPSPAQEAALAREVRAEPGTVHVVDPYAGTRAPPPDRFGLEETPVVLTAIVEEDVEAFLAELDEQEIGARRGDPTGDGGVEIVVHAANLADAQAVLVEFTGDVTLVDDIADPEQDEGAMAVVAWARLQDAGVQANRLRDRGIDVRIELPDEAQRGSPAAQAAILVPVDLLDRAREILGIEL